MRYIWITCLFVLNVAISFADQRAIQEKAMCEVAAGLVNDKTKPAEWICQDEQPIGDFCKWSYVACNDQNLIEDINFYGRKVSGSLSTYIGDLTTITYIVLNKNNFIGTLPTEIGKLTALRELGLGHNSFTGTIPTEIGNLVKIDNALELFSNQLTGSIPTQLGRLVGTEWFMFDGNQLTGKIPEQFCNLPNLKHLQLKGNKFTCVPACLALTPDSLAKSVDDDVEECPIEPTEAPVPHPTHSPASAPTTDGSEDAQGSGSFRASDSSSSSSGTSTTFYVLLAFAILSVLGFIFWYQQRANLRNNIASTAFTPVATADDDE